MTDEFGPATYRDHSTKRCPRRGCLSCELGVSRSWERTYVSIRGSLTGAIGADLGELSPEDYIALDAAALDAYIQSPTTPGLLADALIAWSFTLGSDILALEDSKKKTNQQTKQHQKNICYSISYV